jgi:hypothetical protein
MASEIKVDTISEKTSAGGVTIDSVVHKDSAVYPSSADGGALGSASNEWSDLFLADSSVIKFGADQDTLLTHTDGTGLTLNSTNKLCFNDASQFVQGSSATVLSIGATDEIDLTATAVDLNGTLNVSGIATFQATPVFPDGSLALADLDIDGGTDIGADIVDADLFIIDDGAGGTNRKTAASRIKTYVGGGITTASIWRLTAGFDGDADPIASNLEETDAPTGFGVLGSSMTESSGVFTFPSTGYWFIIFNLMVSNDTADGRSVITIKTTHDDSTYAAASNANVWAANGGYNNATCEYIFDVTSTSTHKCSFKVDATNSSNGCLGGTDLNYTSMTFIRLGDT